MEHRNVLGVVRDPRFHEWVVELRPVVDNPVIERSGNETPARGDNYSGIAVLVYNGVEGIEVDRVASVRANARNPKRSFKKALKAIAEIAQAQCDALNESEARLDDARCAANKVANRDLLKHARAMYDIRDELSRHIHEMEMILHLANVDLSSVRNDIDRREEGDELA